MKKLKTDLDKDGGGEISLRPEQLEDLWHLYHLIAVGDRVGSTTVRRVQKESNTGSVDSERVRLNITIAVEKIDFEPEGGVLRLNGPNVVENKFLKMGQYHTLELEMNRNVKIGKDHWDMISRERIKNACNPATFAEIAAVTMAEGMAHLCLITRGMTIVRAKIETNIPRKRKGAIGGHTKALNKFFENVLQAVIRHIDFEVVKCVLIASPGFVQEQYLDYMFTECTKRNIKVIMDNKQKFLPCHSTSGFKHSLKEVMMDPAVQDKLADVHALDEVKALNDFYDMLKTDSDRAFYGINHITEANKRLAIQSLLLTDELFRSADIPTRKKYVGLVQSVRKNGGEVFIFSSLHVSGEQLGQLGGIAAVLRYPITDIDDSDDDLDDDGDYQQI